MSTWQEWKDRAAALEPRLAKYLALLYETKGGPGSGHYGHAGRPGQRGGSVSASTAVSLRTGRTAQERQRIAAGGDTEATDLEQIRDINRQIDRLRRRGGPDAQAQIRELERQAGEIQRRFYPSEKPRAVSDLSKAKITDKEQQRIISLVQDNAEQTAKERYIVRPSILDPQKFTLSDIWRPDSAGMPHELSSGTEIQMYRKLRGKIKAARNRAEKMVRNRIAAFHSDIDMGFYDDLPDGAFTDRVRILGGDILRGFMEV